MMTPYFSEFLAEDEKCLSCDGETPKHECPKAVRSCGHHCNCSWIQDICHWCKTEFGENGAESVGESE